MEEQIDEEQLLEDEEQSHPTMEQEEHKDQQIPKNRLQKNHPIDQIIGDKNSIIGTRRRLSKRNEQVHFSLLSTTEPRNFAYSNIDEQWVKAMEEELDQIEKNETWELVPRQGNKNVIDTKWVFRNKMNEDGQVIRNKARLVCKAMLRSK